MRLLLLLSIITISTTIINALTCELCQFSVKAAEDLVTQNFTKNQIIPYLDSACSLLPNQWASNCETIVNIYGLSMIKLVLENETPEVSCTQLGLCGSNSFLSESKKETLGKWHWNKQNLNPIKKLECSACHFAVGKAENVVNEDINTAKAYVDSQCNAFGIKEAVRICKRIVDKEIVRIITELKNHESKGAVCKHIHMC
ncbi:hypothetical protein ACTA71_005468 [Dictyostelium dimigraforme]